jgi:DNA-binding NtrC family response regulator
MEYTVLFVDDDQNLLEALGRLLHDEPFRIVTAQSAEKAMEILGENSVDVIVSDQEMPGLKGTQFLWKVRNAHPDMILFMLTGRATAKMAKLAIDQIGIARLVTKPCNAFDLALAIRQALQHRDLLRHSRALLHVFRTQEALLHRVQQVAPKTVLDARKVLGTENAVVDAPSDEEGLVKTLHQVLADRCQLE